MRTDRPQPARPAPLFRSFYRESIELVLIVLVGLILVLFAASQIVLGGSFAQLEEQDTRENVERVFDALQSDLAQLNSKTGDWANWDDAYAFVQNRNPEFIKTNITDNAFNQLEIHLILFLDPSGQIIYGKAFDLDRQVEMALPAGLVASLADPPSRAVLLRTAQPQSALTGILSLSEGPLLIASRPVMTSDGNGPPRGTLLFGRYLDADEIHHLADTTHLTLALLALDSPDLPRAFQPNSSSIFVQPSSENEIAGYQALKDIFANPTHVLRISTARDIYQQGQIALHYFRAWVLGISLAFGVMIIWISSNLRRSWQALNETNERYQVVIENAADGIILAHPKTKQILEANAAFRSFLGYSAEEITPLTLYDLFDLSREKVDRDTQRFLERQQPLVIEQQLVRKDGSLIQVESSANFIHYHGEPVVCVVVRDITTRKREQIAKDRHRRELEAERVVANAVSQTLDLNRVLELALDQVLATLQTDAGAIYLADEAQTELTLAVSRHPSPEFPKRWGIHAFGEGITGSAAAERQILNIPNLDQDSRVSQDNRESPRLLSQVSVPLIAQNRVVGVLNVNSFAPHHFSDDDVALLRAIAASVSVAIDHARLFETLEQRVTKRTEELAALNRIASAINQSLELDEILATALDELMRTLQVSGGLVHLMNPEKNQLELRAESGATSTIRELNQIVQVGEGLLGRMMLHRESFALNVATLNPSFRQALGLAGFQSICAVPLVVDERAVGVLWLASDQVDRFGEADLRWLTAAGNTIAVSLKNARVFESVERNRTQLATLRDIDRTLSSMLDLEQMLDTTLSRLELIVPFDSAAVFLLEGKHLTAVAARGREETALRNSKFDIADNAIFTEMNAQRAPIVLSDLRQDRRWMSMPGIEFARSWLGAPLVARGELIGQLGLFSAIPSAFTREHVNLVFAFADHAGIAIANARLHALTRRNAERVELLNTIARTVGSTIELNDLLETCLHQLLQVIHADSYFIALYNSKEDMLELLIDFDAGHRYPPSKQPGSQGLSSLVLRDKKPLLIRRLSEERTKLPVQPHITGTGIASESWLGVPMIVGEEIVGLIAIGSYQPNAFDEEDMALLSNVASQVAIAIDNAQHHAEVEEQARRDSLTQAFNHGYLLKRLRAEIELAQYDNRTVSLIMLDIDYFKAYNDTYGHVVGDEVLRLTVQAIQTHLKKTDSVGRWGGEEFAVVLPMVTTEQALMVAERIRLTLAQLPLVDRAGNSLANPTVSEGIATFPIHALNAEKLVDAADQALYIAKDRGRDQIQVASTK